VTATVSERAEVIEAVGELGRFAAELTRSFIPPAVIARLELMLVDLFGVTLAGVATPEFGRLLSAWNVPEGHAPVFGTRQSTNPETAAMLVATAACMLELDEGNKHAQGHPAVQIVFAALAAAQLSDRPVRGDELLVAIAAGYEVAARFGRALTRNTLWHTHGHWGAAGAACAAALIGGASGEEVSAAIDSSAGLMTVAPWAIVLAGDFTRNLWVGSANVAGLIAARLARAGLAKNSGALHAVLGTIVGTLDAHSLTAGLGEHWLVAEGYGKTHSSCSYTHGAVDIVQDLRKEHPFTAADVRSVLVETHSLAAPLFRPSGNSRLSAMFSLPFVVAAAIVNEHVDPAAMDPGGATFSQSKQLSRLVDVAVSPDFDALLPGERWTSVEIELIDRTRLNGSTANPRGDADHLPFGVAQIDEKLRLLIGAPLTAVVRTAVADLLCATDVTAAWTKSASAVTKGINNG
jgi:2-methylcitrate dehydratase PrpD